MKIPISTNDYVFTDDKYIYPIIKICMDNSHMKIFVLYNEKEHELQWDNKFYYLEGQIVKFLLDSLLYNVDEYLTLENISPDNEILQEEGLETLIQILNKDDFWHMRFLNDFIHIPNINTILATKPYSMDWRQFYKHFITMSDVGHVVKVEDTPSIFDSFYRFLGLK